MDQEQQDNLVKVGVAGAAGVAGYYFLYKPWALKRELERVTQEAIAANLARGMSLADATANAIAGACTAAAAAGGMPPQLAGVACQGVGLIATKGLQLAGKGAIIAGKVLGKGTVAAGKAVGKGTVAAGKAVGKGTVAAGKAIGKGAVAVTYKAPVAAGKAVGKGTVAVGKAVGKSTVAVTYKAPKAAVKSVVKNVTKLFGGGPNINCSVPQKAANAAYCKQRYPTVDRTALDKGVKGLSGIKASVRAIRRARRQLPALAGFEDVASAAYIARLSTPRHVGSMLAELSAPPRHRANPLDAPTIHKAAKRPAGAASVSRRRVSVSVSPRHPSASVNFYNRYL